MAKVYGHEEQPKVLTSDELNYLIYRYLQECGFHHSAFTFAHESHVGSVQIQPNLVPPAALVTFVQKGLQYMEAEANLEPETGEVAKEFAVLAVEDLLTKDIDELRQQAMEARDKMQDTIRDALAKLQPQQEQNQQPKVKRTGSKRERAPAQQQQQKAAAAEEEQPQQQQQPQQPARIRGLQKQRQQQQQVALLKQEQQEQDDAPQQQPQRQPQRQQQRAQAKGQQQQQQKAEPAADAAAAAAAGDGAVPMEEDTPAVDSTGLEVVSAEEHEGAVDAFICQWSPTELLVLTGSSGDPHARIYDFRPGADHSKPRILALPEEQRAENKDVTAAEWHPSGNSVVAGSFKGVIRVWHKDGTLQHVVSEHTSPVFTLRWNKRGDLLITGSADKGTKVLDATTWRLKQTFTPHASATLDADWRDDSVFATCSNDGSIAVCKMGSDKALKTWPGDPSTEVTLVRWGASGDILASVGDDWVVKLWRLSQDSPVAVFRHDHEVFTIKWSPAPPAGGQGQLLATTSLDKTVRLFDTQSGREVLKLVMDGDSPYCLCFSPEGKFMAAGCNDGFIRIFCPSHGAREVCTHKTKGNLCDVAWSRAADKVAFTTGGQKIGVLHLKRV